jgi:hypothetical protein
MALQRQRSQLLALEQGRHTRLNIPGLPSHRTRSTPPEGWTPWRISALRARQRQAPACAPAAR